jgi:hypothetical protein
MSFQYTNPYAPQQQVTPSRPAFATQSTVFSGGFQVLLGGLPADVSEHDVKVSSNSHLIPPRLNGAV